METVGEDLDGRIVWLIVVGGSPVTLLTFSGGVIGRRVQGGLPL